MVANYHACPLLPVDRLLARVLRGYGKISWVRSGDWLRRSSSHHSIAGKHFLARASRVAVLNLEYMVVF